MDIPKRNFRLLFLVGMNVWEDLNIPIYVNRKLLIVLFLSVPGDHLLM